MSDIVSDIHKAYIKFTLSFLLVFSCTQIYGIHKALYSLFKQFGGVKPGICRNTLYKLWLIMLMLWVEFALGKVPGFFTCCLGV